MTTSNGPAVATAPARRRRSTLATSPSPKLDSTPAMCTSASGQICWMMPVMNVPWPASKSSVPLPSSSNSSSSSIAPAGAVCSHGECSRAHVRYGVLDRRCPLRRRSAARCRGSAPSGRCDRPRASGCGSHAGWRRRVRRRLQHRPDRRVHDVGREHHPAGEVASRRRPGCRARPGSPAPRGWARRWRRRRGAGRAPAARVPTPQRRSPWIGDRLLVRHARRRTSPPARRSAWRISPAWRSSNLAIAASAAANDSRCLADVDDDRVRAARSTSSPRPSTANAMRRRTNTSARRPSRSG